MNIIDGHKIANQVKDSLAKKVFKHKELRPSLAIILIGEREDSALYVKLKEKAAKEVGIDTHLYKLSQEIQEEELFSVIDFLNNDQQIDAILLQLPIPQHLDTKKIISRINLNKEVDGLSSKIVNSPLVSAVQASLESVNFDKNKKACLLYKSEEFGQSLKNLLVNKFDVNILPKEKTNQADLIISALGKPGFIKENDIKENAVLIDIGINKLKGKVVGDFDFLSVKNKASHITPVPGGIGPMTVAFLLENVWQLYSRKNKIK